MSSLALKKTQTANALLTEKTCPNCNKHYPVYENEVEWCHLCDWSLQPDSDPFESAYQKIYRRLGRRISASLHDSMLANPHQQPRLSLAKVVAYIFATCIHLSYPIWATAGILSFFLFPLWGAAIISALCFSFLYVTFPRMQRWPKKDLLSRSDAPMLYELSDRISDQLGTSRLHGLALNDSYNAFYMEFGIGPWRKKLVSLGVPFLITLNEEEIVALMAHEISHGANGDIGRSVYMRSALQTLRQWFHLLTPQSINEGRVLSNDGFETMIGNLTGYVFGWLPRIGFHILARLQLRDAQVAEYLADGLSMRAAGSSATISLLQKIYLGDLLDRLAQKVATTTRPEQMIVGLIDNFKTASMKSFSAHETERIRRTELEHGLGLDTTHPPTIYRVAYISAFKFADPAIRISRQEALEIRNLIDERAHQSFKKVVDDWRGYLYL